MDLAVYPSDSEGCEVTKKFNKMFRCKNESFADTKTFYTDLWTSTPPSPCREKAKEPSQYIAILDWLKKSETVKLLNIIQDDITTRLSDAASEQTRPNKELYDLLSAVMVGRVQGGFQTVLGNYKKAVGKDPLTVATVLKAMNVDVGPALPPPKKTREKSTGTDQSIATPLSKLRKMFSDIGLPASLLPVNDTTGGSGVNMVAIASYIAMVIALTSMAKLAADIRGTK